MLIVRRVLPIEYHKYRTHLLSLDADSRYLRFGYRAPDSAIHKICDTVESNPDVHVLYCVEDKDLNFVGVAHIAIEENTTELAFSVLKEHQGRGIGSALMHRAILHCRTRNIKKSHLVCLQSNAAIRKLCIKHGIAVRSECNESIGAVEFSKPEFDTFIAEITASQLGAFDYFAKRIPQVFTKAVNKC